MGTGRRVAIACQGGGSHAAFTAGALGRVLEEDVEVVGLSGSSDGAFCAFLAWHALVTDRRADGPGMLEAFWREVAATDLPDQLANAATLAGGGMNMGPLAEAVNPWFAAAGRSRLTRALEHVVELNDPAARRGVEELPLLLVSAVEVLSGEFTLFRGGEVGVDELLASAAVPGLYEPVRIDGAVYWDGLLSQNPPVRQLAWSRPDEIWVIQVFPRRRETEPRTPAEIRERRAELAANLSLEQEVWFVTRINELIAEGSLSDPYHRPIHIRRIELAPGHAAPSRLDRSRSVVDGLMAEGDRAAADLLASLA